MRRSSIPGSMWRACGCTGVVALVLAVVFKMTSTLPLVVPLYLKAGCVAFVLAAFFGIADYGLRAFFGDLKESTAIAFAQIRANKLRSMLTALGVIIGIVAVTLMGTAINGIDVGVDRSFSGFGDDVLYVQKYPWSGGNEWWTYRNRRPVRHEYAKSVNEWIAANPASALKLAVPVANRGTNIVRGEYRVNNIWTMGTSAEYPRTVRSEVKEGRFFSDFEAQSGANIAFLGFDVADALFPNESAVGATIRIRDQNFKVVGVAARQGSFLGLFSWDSMIAMPITTYRRYFKVTDDVQIRVQVDPTRMDEARDELRGLMRRVRQLPPENADDFSINEQGTIRAQLDPIKNGIFMAGLAITGLSLFVGAIGIMNITYVSVKERTKEIGTRKALGARRRTILLQFLVEAVAICVIGGGIGLLVTVGLSDLVAVLAPSFPLVFSTNLVLLALGAAFVVGVLSGFAPAWAASKLDPVVALRYE